MSIRTATTLWQLLMESVLGISWQSLFFQVSELNQNATKVLFAKLYDLQEIGPSKTTSNNNNSLIINLALLPNYAAELKELFIRGGEKEHDSTKKENVLLQMSDLEKGLLNMAENFISRNSTIQSRSNAFLRSRVAKLEQDIYAGKISSMTKEEIENDVVFLKNSSLFESNSQHSLLLLLPESPQKPSRSNSNGSASGGAGGGGGGGGGGSPRHLFRSTSTGLDETLSPSTVFALEPSSRSVLDSCFPDFFSEDNNTCSVSLEDASKVILDRHSEMWSFVDEGLQVVHRLDLERGLVNLAVDFILNDEICQILANYYLQRKLRMAMLTLTRALGAVINTGTDISAAADVFSLAAPIETTTTATTLTLGPQAAANNVISATTTGSAIIADYSKSEEGEDSKMPTHVNEEASKYSCLCVSSVLRKWLSFPMFSSTPSRKRKPRGRGIGRSSLEFTNTQTNEDESLRAKINALCSISAEEEREIAFQLTKFAESLPNFEMPFQIAPEPLEIKNFPITFFIGKRKLVLKFFLVDYGVSFRPFTFEDFGNSHLADSGGGSKYHSQHNNRSKPLSLYKSLFTRHCLNETNRCFFLHLGIATNLHPVGVYYIINIIIFSSYYSYIYIYLIILIMFSNY